ncbi:MAG: hypothetical protein HC904_04415 [Blastochloris sp.]|nr:hypothetical protein [Blastochloris sp.]
MQPGTHSVRLYLDNVSIYRSLNFKSLTLEAIDGVDLDGNGIDDWQEARLAAQNALKTQSPESRSSPYCLEGESKYFEGLRVGRAGAAGGALTTELPVQRGVGQGWYAELPLDASGPVIARAELENGGKILEKTVTWTPTNVLLGETLRIRKGDSLLLSAAPTESNSGQASLEVRQAEVSVATYQIQGQGTQVHTFSQSGTHQVLASYQEAGNPPVTGVLTVEVKEASFADPDPVIALGYYRDWLNPALSPEAIIEVDGRMEVVELPTPATGGRNFRLRADAAEPRVLLARLDDGTANGPILDRAEIKATRVSSGIQTGIYYVDQFADGSQLVEMRVVLSSVPEDIRLKFDIFVAGITFEDGSTVKWFTAEDFNDQGELKVRFIKAASVKSSVCHRLYIYQGNTLLETRTN